MLLQTIVPSLWSMPSARMQSQARKLLRYMGLYLLRVQSFHHAFVQIQSMQRQSIHRVRHVEGLHMASDDQSIMMFPVPLHQRQEAASPFYMCHAVGQCWVLPPANSMCISTNAFPKPHESHSMCLHTILELYIQSSACVRVSHDCVFPQKNDHAPRIPQYRFHGPFLWTHWLQHSIKLSTTF